MKQIIEKVTLVKLEAAESMTITDKERTIFSKLIYLGKGDSAENYEEIPDVEAEQCKQQIKINNYGKKENFCSQSRS